MAVLTRIAEVPADRIFGELSELGGPVWDQGAHRGVILCEEIRARGVAGPIEHAVFTRDDDVRAAHVWCSRAKPPCREARIGIAR